MKQLRALGTATSRERNVDRNEEFYFQLNLYNFSEDLWGSFCAEYVQT